MNKKIAIKNSKIKFNEKEHRYFVDVRELVSVTKIIHQFFPEFIANDIAEKKAEGCPIKRDEILKDWEIRNLSGTAVHNFLEDYVKTGQSPNDNDFQNKADEIGTNINNLKLRFLAGKQFIKDMILGGWKPFISEWIVWSEELGLAGTIDLAFINDNNEIYIADYKCTKRIYQQSWSKKEFNGYDLNGIPKYKYTSETAFYPIDNLENCNFIKYSLQLTAYKYILEKEYGVNVKGCCLVHLLEGRSQYKIYDTLILEGEFEKIIEVKT